MSRVTLRALAHAGLVLAACTPSPKRAAAPAPAPTTARTAPSAPASSTPRLTLDLGSDATVEQRVVVRIDLESVGATTLRFAPIHRAKIVELEARDDAGPIALQRSADANGARFELTRHGVGTAHLRYAIEFERDEAASADGFEPVAQPIDLRVLGRDVLVLPELEPALPVTIRLRTGALRAGGASSFGLGVEQTTAARVSELRDAYFLAGDVGTASFHASDGDDVAAWSGFTAFDPRWVSAITAGVRSAVDAYVGRFAGAGGPARSLLFNASNAPRPARVVVRSSPRGVVVSVDPRASWTASARLLVAQALAQRYVGGVLSVGDSRDEAAGRFFAVGFARAIARDVLAEVGLLAPDERAAELDALLATTVFATDDAASLAAARGALVATSLDAKLRAASAGRSSLKTLVRELLAQAANAHERTISRSALFDHVRSAVGAGEGARLERALDGSAEVELPADLLGPCYRLVRKELVPFELGFVTSADAEMKVTSVKPDSRAAAAGVRVGDVVSDLHYEDDRSSVPVEVTITRDGKKQKLRFLPAGPARRGRTFERVAGVPDSRC